METIPTLTAFEQLAHKGNLIPVYREFLADTETPVSAYLKIREASFSFLLESAQFGKRWGRYSFIGCNPSLVVFVRDQEMEIWNGHKKTNLNNVKNPLKILRDLNRKFRHVANHKDLPFLGGLVGYFNYDLVRKWEPIGGRPSAEQDGPESVFMASGRLIIFDHLTHLVKVVVLVHLEDGDNLRKAYEQAIREIDGTISRLRAPLSRQTEDRSLHVSPLVPNVSKGKFEEAVLKAKDYIMAGDVIQVVLSQRFSGAVSGDPFILYRTLRSINPSPYMFYLSFGDTKLIGASPEVLVRLTGGKIDLRPIAGTRPRGATTKGDEALEKELLADPKERAEHIMHGKTSAIYHDQESIYEYLPVPFEATRYHFLIVERKTLTEYLEVSAWTEEGEVMGVRHREFKVEGVQFHPESILTLAGTRLYPKLYYALSRQRRLRLWIIL